MTKANTQKVVAEVLAGRHDGQLVDIMEAIGQRVRTSDVRLCWRLRLDGEAWDEQTITSGELAFAEKLLKISYVGIEPKSRIEHRIALVIAHLHKVHGVEVEKAVERAEAMTLPDQEQMFEMYEVDDNPKADPPPSETS